MWKFPLHELYSIRLVQKAFSSFKERNIFACKILNISSDRCDQPEKQMFGEAEREKNKVLLCMLNKQDAPPFYAH